MVGAAIAAPAGPGGTSLMETPGMRKRARWTSCVLVLSGVVGCLRPPSDRPLTTADLNRLAASRSINASLERTRDHSTVSFGGDAFDTASKVLLSMTPVISSGAAVGDMKPEYVFAFQSGRNPIWFNIRVCGDVLCYRVGTTDYRGGDAKEFLSVAEDLLR